MKVERVCDLLERVVTCGVGRDHTLFFVVKCIARLLAAVVRLGVYAIKLAHTRREVAFRRLDHQMIVIGHLAPRMDRPVEPFTTLRQRGQPKRSIRVVVIDIFTSITARRYVIEGTSKFETQRTGHERSLLLLVLFCKT